MLKNYYLLMCDLLQFIHMPNKPKCAAVIVP